ncbi:BnaC05g21650D [Brassica napus]|uniref:BnaC05g21650D protein n=1 Tax=Brassica napus TaxID=3708 RepID=A0A078I8T3_BRANA|nr:BnaC05g21650D [Brassica napus]
MAEHLASIYGTEKDRVNCPFYNKMGACRHGDRCSRIHNRPAISPTLLLSNMRRPAQDPRAFRGSIRGAQEFKEEDQAAAALQALQGRSYLGRPIIGEFSPIVSREKRRKLFGRRSYRRGSRSRSISPRGRREYGRRDRDS